MISFANFNVNHKVLRNLSEKLDYKNPTAFQKLYGKEVISKKQNFIEFNESKEKDMLYLLKAIQDTKKKNTISTTIVSLIIVNDSKRGLEVLKQLV